MVLEDGGLDGGRDSQYQREDQDGDGHSDVNLSLPLHLSGDACKLERDVAGESDQSQGGEQVVEGEVVGVEPAVVQAALPAEPHVVLHEERRHKTAIGQV